MDEDVFEIYAEKIRLHGILGPEGAMCQSVLGTARVGVLPRFLSSSLVMASLLDILVV